MFKSWSCAALREDYLKYAAVVPKVLWGRGGTCVCTKVCLLFYAYYICIFFEASFIFILCIMHNIYLLFTRIMQESHVCSKKN